MESDNMQEILEIDRNDLFAVLSLRFGSIPQDIQAQIEAITEVEVLERLILTAANAASWEIFKFELSEGKDAFRILGEQFNPVAIVQGGN